MGGERPRATGLPASALVYTSASKSPSPSPIGSLVAIRLLLIAALLALPATAARAQGVPPAVQPDSVTELRLVDGTVVRGQIVESNASVIVLRTAGGTRVEVPRSQIAQQRMVAVRASGEVWDEDPNATRLFFTSTARPLAKGEGYISSFMLFFPFVAYGVTDRITIAGGTPILPGLMGQVFYVAPKVTLMNRPRSSFSVGALGFFVTEEVDEGSVGIVYGAGTFGSTDNAVTVGAGWGYAATSDYSGISNDPVFMIGGERRISRRVKLITENWLGFGGGETAGLVSGGFRFIGDRISADLGFGGMLGTESACCIPLVNFVYSFGRQGR